MQEKLLRAIGTNLTIVRSAPRTVDQCCSSWGAISMLQLSWCRTSRPDISARPWTMPQLLGAISTLQLSSWCRTSRPDISAGHLGSTLDDAAALGGHQQVAAQQLVSDISSGHLGLTLAGRRGNETAVTVRLKVWQSRTGLFKMEWTGKDGMDWYRWNGLVKMEWTGKDGRPDGGQAGRQDQVGGQVGLQAGGRLE